MAVSLAEVERLAGKLNERDQRRLMEGLAARIDGRGLPAVGEANRRFLDLCLSSAAPAIPLPVVNSPIRDVRDEQQCDSLCRNAL